MAVTQLGLPELRRQFAHENLERLSRFEPPTKPPPGKSPFGDDAPCKVTLSILQKWSKDNESTMQTAIE